MQISEEQVVTAGPMVTIFMATFCEKGAVAATQCSKGATIAYLAACLMGQLAAWGLGSGALVLRADKETSLTTLLDEIKARRAETLVERTAVESHQSIGAVERVNREVAGLLRTPKTALETRIGTKVGLEHDLISWMIRHSAWLVTRFRVRTSGQTAYELIRRSSARLSGRGSPQRRSSESWISVGSRSFEQEMQKAATNTSDLTIEE